VCVCVPQLIYAVTIWFNVKKLDKKPSPLLWGTAVFAQRDDLTVRARPTRDACFGRCTMELGRV
jgi:hypothetical protein